MKAIIVDCLLNELLWIGIIRSTNEKNKSIEFRNITNKNTDMKKIQFNE